VLNLIFIICFILFKELSALRSRVKRVLSAMEKLCKLFKIHLKEERLGAVQAFEDLKTYIATIWKVYEKHEVLAKHSLASDSVFHMSLDKVNYG